MDGESRPVGTVPDCDRTPAFPCPQRLRNSLESAQTGARLKTLGAGKSLQRVLIGHNQAPYPRAYRDTL